MRGSWVGRMPEPTVLDYDIGYDWDDVVTHVLATRSSELNVVLILTNDECGGRRARLARQLLRLAGLDIPVVAGTDLGNEHFVADPLLDAVEAPLDNDWRGALRACLDRYGTVDYLGLGAMTNIATFAREYPGESRGLRLLQMGGSIGAHRSGSAEHNVRLDAAAFRYLLRSGMPARFVMAHTTNRPEIEVNPGSEFLDALRRDGSPELNFAAEYFDLWYRARGHGSFLHDPLTCSALLDPRLVSFTTAQFVVSHSGWLDVAPENHVQLRDTLVPLLDEEDPLRGYLERAPVAGVAGERLTVEFSYLAAYDEFCRLLLHRLVG